GAVGYCGAWGGGSTAGGTAGLIPLITSVGPEFFLGGPEKSGRLVPPACSNRTTRAARSTGRRGWPVVAPAALGLRPVDAVQQHRQLGGAEGHAGLALRRGRPAPHPLL